MRTGEVEANLVRLNESAGLSHLDELIARKVEGAEKSTLDNADLDFHFGEYERLRGELEAAHQDSHIQETSDAQHALHDLLVRVRLATADS